MLVIFFNIALRFLFCVFGVLRGCEIRVYPCSSVVLLQFSRSLGFIRGFYSVVGKIRGVIDHVR